MGLTSLELGQGGTLESRKYARLEEMQGSTKYSPDSSWRNNVTYCKFAFLRGENGFPA